MYRWLRQLKADSRSSGQGTQAILLPQGMNFRAALVAEGYCQEVGFESPAAGKFCRTKGVILDEIKRFSTWLAQHDDDVVLSASARAREQELINKVTALSEEQKQQNRELQRKEKALAEAAALLVLTKKAQAIWGDSGINNVTPLARFNGADVAICKARRQVMAKARQQHPE